MYGVAFTLSFSALAIALFGAVWFVTWWFVRTDRPQILLWWAYGMFALLLFKIPNILVNADVAVFQKDFYPFFFVTMTAYFLSFFAFIRGLMHISKRSFGDRTVLYLRIWFLACIAYFALAFFAPGFDVSYTPVWVSHLLFYIPAQILLLKTLFNVLNVPTAFPRPFGAGIICAVSGTITLMFSSVFYILLQVSAVRPEHWYYTIVSSSMISVLQIASATLLFLGFLFLGRSYLKNSTR